MSRAPRRALAVTGLFGPQLCLDPGMRRVAKRAQSARQRVVLDHLLKLPRQSRRPRRPCRSWQWRGHPQLRRKPSYFYSIPSKGTHTHTLTHNTHKHTRIHTHTHSHNKGVQQDGPGPTQFRTTGSEQVPQRSETFRRAPNSSEQFRPFPNRCRTPRQVQGTRRDPNS